MAGVEGEAGGAAAHGLGFAVGLDVFPTRTARDAFVVVCGWPLWGGIAVGGCGQGGGHGSGDGFGSG